MRWLIAAGVASLCFCAAVFGTFVPLRTDQGIEYLYAWPGLSTLLASAAALTAILIFLHVVIVRFARLRAPLQLEAAKRGWWLAPLVPLGLVAVGILPAVPGIGHRGAAVSYFLFDLRWWWTAIAVGLAAWRVDRLLGGRVATAARRLARLPQRRRFEILLFLVVVAWSVATSPLIRFSGDLHGDEPKYLRYCEVWYQGGGFEITGKKAWNAADRMPHMLSIPAVLLRAVAQEVPQLARDVRDFAMGPRTFQWNRASGDEGYVIGKRGGMYQMYQPGPSLFLFPGYFLDRLVFARHAGYQGEFPAELWMTNLSMLLLHGACAIALFSLLRRVLGSDVLACAWSALAFLTLPTTAFAFQLYPEVPSMLIVLLTVNYVLFHADAARVRSVAAAGAGAAFLAWMHPRFLPVSLVLVAAGFAATPPRRRRIFSIAAGLVYVSLAAFCYRITGSMSPTALWAAAGPDSAINPLGIPANLLGYAFDRTWGLVPHALILFAVVPGLVLVARENARLAVLVAALGLALGAPAAGHTLSAAGATPGRLVVAVLPLLFVPVAVLVRRHWTSAAARAATVIAVIVSLETALSYNLRHMKEIGQLRTKGASGWRPNLAFPVLRGDEWTTGSNLALICACLALVAVASWLAVRGRRREAASSRPVRAAAVVALLVIGGSTAASGASRLWLRDEYMMDDVEARRRAAADLLALARCQVCFTSRQAAVDWRKLSPNPAESVHLDVFIDGFRVTFDTRLNGNAESRGFARMRLEFGDGEATDWIPIVGERRVTHTYQEAKSYPIVLWVELRDGSQRGDRRTITIAAAK